jgi:uncharacterized protein YjbJ (UPF0337 family)
MEDDMKSGMDMTGKGMFDRIVGEAKKEFGDITDDDVQKAEGDVQKLVGIIEQKTGETPDKIRHMLHLAA